MEGQVTGGTQPGAYYVDPNGPRYENPADFSEAAQGQEIPQPPQASPTLNFEAMRQEAMRKAIEQIAAQKAAIPKPQPQPQPVAPAPVYQPAPTAQVNEQVRVVRRNLTKPELAAIFVAACIAVTGVQAVWNFTTNILPRIEIRSN